MFELVLLFVLPFVLFVILLFELRRVPRRVPRRARRGAGVALSVPVAAVPVASVLVVAFASPVIVVSPVIVAPAPVDIGASLPEVVSVEPRRPRRFRRVPAILPDVNEKLPRPAETGDNVRRSPLLRARAETLTGNPLLAAAESSNCIATPV